MNMNIVLKQTFTAGILATMMATVANAAPTEAPPAFVKRVADGLIYVDGQAFTRIVMGTYATNQYSNAAQRAKFEQNFRNTLIENYGSAFAKFTNQTYTMRPYKASASKNPVVTIDFNNKGEKIPVSFQLSDQGSQWKIRNINVSGIDLGLQFRNQFAANVQRNNGNIDKAIATFKPDADAAVKK